MKIPVTQIDIPEYVDSLYRSIPRNKDLDYKISNSCNVTSRTLVIDWQGNCFVCPCEAWLPICVGNITDFATLDAVWQSSGARMLQQDINDKKFSHCAVDRCGVLHNNVYFEEYYVSINIDESCNLKCPSCRTDLKMLKSGPDYEDKLHKVNHIINLLENFDKPIQVVMTGNGDPLASNIMRPLIHNYNPAKKQRIRLFTNGLLLEKHMTKSSIANHVDQYFISIDAGSKEVYEKVRLGGKFNTLIANFEFLRDFVKDRPAEVLLKFVLQKDNYLDMQNFIDLASNYGFNCVINRLEDWGTWTDFSEHDVIGNKSHPEHTQAIAELNKIYKLYKNKDPGVQFNPSLKDICNGRY